MRWAGFVARIKEMYTKFGHVAEGKNHLEDLGVDGKIIKEWIVEGWDMKLWIGFMWLSIGASGMLLSFGTHKTWGIA
jgi:hypothetical protein